MNETTCPGCGLLYDLSAYRPGQRCRCRCGQVLIARAPAPVRIARAIHCSACGGNLERGRPDCPYCGALIDMTDARLTAYCGACLSMNKEGATFCADCGGRLAACAEAPEATDEECPRCRVRMRRRSVAGHRPLECPMCCGLFVAAPELEALIRAQEDRGDLAAAAQGKEPERAALHAGEVEYLKCPACGRTMNRVNYGRLSGVIIDSCKEHGHWLDAGELEKIARWVATGGLDKLRERQLGELREERERLSSERLSRAQDPAGASVYAGGADGAWGGWTVVRLLIDLIGK